MKGKILMAVLLSAAMQATAQVAIVEESTTQVDCYSSTNAVVHYKEVTTILNEHGADLANFVCWCSKHDKLNNFKGVATDATGRILRKFKEGELKQTEYSQYLAIDDYKMFLEYTPPVYPITITYEWTMESHDNLIEFPRFCPQSDYDVSVKKATYRLTAPKEMTIRHALLNIDKTPTMSADGRTLTLELENLPALKYEPYSRPLRERIPMAYFAPEDFTYYGKKGCFKSWQDYGKWEYSLINGRETLPEDIKQEIHQMTDHLTTDREKVEALYKHLEKTTRYVAVLLGIGGLQPAPAASVCKSGFGDCKGLSNYMRAMLKEVGIASNYTTISTTNRRLLKDFASVGQMNHVILQVPLKGDTLWLECTNPQLPLGFVHEDIAGHDAIEVSEAGGRLVTLPVYPDTTNLMRSTIHIEVEDKGAANVTLQQETRNGQYENRIALLHMDEKERQKVLQRIVRVPQAEIGKIDIREEGAAITLDAEVKSQKYASVTGQRLFVPVCPIHRGYSAPNAIADRKENVWVEEGYVDEDDITIAIPEGYEVEAMPKSFEIDKPFGTFSFMVVPGENSIMVTNRLVMKSGQYDKSQYPDLIDFIKTISNAYGQKVVLKKKGF
ncbi:Transglutaminase-like superfamily protein [Prevotellaceae bacterium HUN156]|nr:Transglutaminase-like superfamily protein [Prevotellaceae bacterium HUN156]